MRVLILFLHESIFELEYSKNLQFQKPLQFVTKAPVADDVTLVQDDPFVLVFQTRWCGVNFTEPLRYEAAPSLREHQGGI